jgi:hypothetical protein
MRWAGYVACMGVIINAYNILVGKLKGRDHWEDPAANGTVIL